MGKKQQTTGLSFSDQKKVVKYFVPFAIVALLFVALGDIMQKDLTYPKLKKETGKLVYIDKPNHQVTHVYNKRSSRHIEIWIESQQTTLKYYASIRHAVDAEKLTSKLVLGDTLTVYTYNSTQKLLKPRARRLILAIQHNNQDILSLNETKYKSRFSLYISFISIIVLISSSLLFWYVYVPKKEQQALQE